MPINCGDSNDTGVPSVWKIDPETGFSGGAFHYMIRASGYGDVWDEIPWRVQLGTATDKGRDALDATARICRYSHGVNIHNWVEDSRDRVLIKCSRPNPISQYAHLYQTTYGTSIGNKSWCNKEPALLRLIPQLPSNAYPGHQPELDVDRLRRCVDKSFICINREERDAYFKDIQHQKRIQRANPPKLGISQMSTRSDPAKCSP